MFGWLITLPIIVIIIVTIIEVIVIVIIVIAVIMVFRMIAAVIDKTTAVIGMIAPHAIDYFYLLLITTTIPTTISHTII